MFRRLYWKGDGFKDEIHMTSKFRIGKQLVPSGAIIADRKYMGDNAQGDENLLYLEISDTGKTE